MKADLLQDFYLGDLLVEPRTGKVTGRAGSTHLPPKAAEVLLCLADNAGELVTYEALLREVWGAGMGSREALGHAVREIRNALGDLSGDPHFIQTLPRRGYRLVVTPIPADEATSSVVLGVANGARASDIGFLELLNRRGVLETGIAYLVVGWLLIQIADIVFGQLYLPAWVGTFVTVLVIAGFPIALVLSWYLEFRDGRTFVSNRLTAAELRRKRFSRTYLSVVGALGAAAVVVFIYDRVVGLPEGDIVAVEQQESDFLPPVLENSFAVLPFVNVDGGEETEVFVNGLVDDLINHMSRVPNLLVSSRGDAYSLAPNSASDEVRRRLRVAHFLEGSVEMSGRQIRVAVQMIKSDTGFHVFSRAFDRPRENFFEIRDEITNLTVASVRAALPGDKAVVALQSVEEPELDVYLLYRRGVDATRRAVSIDNVNEALEWYDAALDIDPEYAAAHAGKCEAYVLAYDELDDPSMIDLAEASCARATQLNPNLVVVHTALGQIYHLTGRYPEAEAAFLRALQIDPSSSESFIGLGDVYLALNRPEQAEENFRQALGLHPGNWSAYNRYGNFLFRQGRYAEAARQYEAVVALDHDNMNGFSNLGVAYMLDGDFSSSLTAYTRSLAIEPKKVTYSNLGLLHYYLGNLEQSIESHRQAIALEPNDYLAWSNLGDSLSISGDEAEARRAFERARELAMIALDANPSDPYTIMDLAWIDSMIGDQQQAVAWIARARELAPDDPYTWYYEGLVLFRGGKPDEAINALSEAVNKGYSPKLLGAEPRFAPLKTDTRFLTIISGN